MTAVEVIHELNRRHIQVGVEGDRLWCSPASELTPDLIERIQSVKSDLIAILDTARGQGDSTTIRCPWCSSTMLIDGLEGRLWCDDCERVAWQEFSDGSIVRADQLEVEQERVDPPEPCNHCGGQEMWQTLARNWRCSRCDPPTAAGRLRKLAARLRKIHGTESEDEH